MPEKLRRVSIYTGVDDNLDTFNSLYAILTKILDPKKYEIHQLKHAVIVLGPTKSWASETDALIVNNDGGDQKFDEQMQKSLVEYFLNSGKIIFLCNAHDGRNALWLLKAASEGEHAAPFPENVGLAFEKFANHQPVPANLQSFQVHKGGQKDGEENVIDYAVGLVRGDSDLSYMYFVCEDGDTAVFVVSPTLSKSGGDKTDFGKSQGKTDSFWRDILRVLHLIHVEVLPISPTQAAQRWAEQSSIGDVLPAPPPSIDSFKQKILIYSGPGEEDKSQDQLENLTATLKRLIVADKYEIEPLKHAYLIQPGSRWNENCAVLFVDNRNWEHRFDDQTRKALSDYFVDSGRVVFFCDPEDGRQAMWLLKTAIAPNEQWPDAVGKAYENFAHNQPVPTDLQAIQTNMKGGQQLTDLSLGLIKSANGAFTYLKCEDGDTAVFVAMTIDHVLKRGSFIWSELLRVVNLPTVANQAPPTAWGGPTPMIGELTRVVKFINTGSSAATAAVASIVGGISDRVSKFWKSDDSTSSSSMKPPNLLIYVQNGDEKENQKKFDSFSTTIREFLASDRYTIYPLKKDHISGVQRAPWVSNCRILFVENENIKDENIKKAFVDYFLNRSGKLIFFTNPADGREALWLLNEAAGPGQKWPDIIGEAYERFIRTGERVVPTEMEKFSLIDRDDECRVDLLGGYRGAPPILHFSSGSKTNDGPEAVFVGATFDYACKEKGEDTWKEILGSVGLDLEKQSKSRLTGVPSAGVFFKNEQAATQIKSAYPNGLIDLTNIKARIGEQPSTDKELTLKIDEYFEYLKTQHLGQVVVYAPVVQSTMPISDDWHNKFGKDDYVIITKQQTQGQGRSGNQWLSPIGSALFSFSIHVPQKTTLGKHLSFLQHLVTLAAADAVHHLHGSLNIRIKWPNDIYYGKDTKIGGVLVKANFVKEEFVVFVGTGINVANHAPTVCLNNFLPPGTTPLTPECVIAITLTRLEELIEEFQSKGAAGVLPLYYKYWLHSDQEVTVAVSGEKVKILGLDEYGFLNVKATGTGRTFTLHPDGNSFDMMANLIEGKEAAVPKMKMK